MQKTLAGARSIAVKGTELDMMEVGTGRPVIFLHGILGDLRTFLPHAELLSSRCRAITYTQRFFGGKTWPQPGPPFGVDTHAQDLIGFVEALGTGPVFVVAWSYSGHVALLAAQLRPELFRSVFVYETGYQTFMSDPEEIAACRADFDLLMNPVVSAIKAEDPVLAVKQMINGLAQDEYYFESRTDNQILIEFENSHSLELLLAQAPPPRITAQELQEMQAAVTIACGAGTRPAYKLISEAAMRYVPGHHFMIPGVGHCWPDAEPGAFSDFIGDWLDDQ